MRKEFENRGFERTPFSFRIGMAVRPNLRNRAAFSNSPGVVWTENFVSLLQNRTQRLLDSFMPLSRSSFHRVSVLLKTISIFGLRIPVFSICQICTDHTLITRWNLSDSGSYVVIVLWQCRSLSFLRRMWDLHVYKPHAEGAGCCIASHRPTTLRVRG